LGSGAHSSEELASIGSAFSQKEMDGLAHSSPFAAAVLDAARRGENVGTGSMGTIDLNSSPLAFNIAADYEGYTDATKAHLRAVADQNYDSLASVQYAQAMEEILANPELTGSVTLDSVNNANDFLAQRSAQIAAKASSELQTPAGFSFDPSAPPAYMNGINADLSGANATDTVFLIGQTMKYAESGDLIGLEAAVQELGKISAMEISSASDDVSKQELEAQHASLLSSTFDKIMDPNFGFKSGVSRDAVAAQIALFRSRTS
jgi:hypothetical protein